MASFAPPPLSKFERIMNELERNAGAPRPRFDAALPLDFSKHERVPDVTDCDLVGWETVRWQFRTALVDGRRDTVVIEVDPTREGEARGLGDTPATMSVADFVGWFGRQMHTFRPAFGLLHDELVKFLAEVERNTAYNAVAVQHEATG